MKIITIPSISRAKEFCKENFNDNCPFINYDFFQLLEHSNCTGRSTGWIPEHILILENEKTVGFIPNFRKLHSYGEFIFDHIFENAFYQLGYDYFPKFLSAIPFTPVTRNNFIYISKSINENEVLKNLTLFLQKQNISSFHINFIDKNISEKLKKKFLKRTGIQYHWHNNKYDSFNDFLNDLKSRKKKNIIKERKYLDEKNIKFTIKTGNEIKESDLLNLYDCYSHTVTKKWSKEYLTKDFFLKLEKSDFIKHTVLISASVDQKFLGCSVHFQKNKNLYGRYWGALFEIPNLHFELCYYQAIEFAIKNKMELVEAGAQGEHKISRGYMPVKTFSCHWFNLEKINKPVKDFFETEESKVDETIEYLKKTQSPFSDK